MFTRRTATVTISAPLASIARRVSAKSLYLPVPTISRERNVRPPRVKVSSMWLINGRARGLFRSVRDADGAWPSPATDELHDLDDVARREPRRRVLLARHDVA